MVCVAWKAPSTFTSNEELSTLATLKKCSPLKCTPSPPPAALMVRYWVTHLCVIHLWLHGRCFVPGMSLFFSKLR